MSRRKQRFFTTLVAIMAFAVMGSASPRTPESDVLLNMRPAVLRPVQSRDVKRLRAGMLLVASRGLGDPRFAETVILLVRHDAQGVLGLILNRRTDVPLSRVLDLKAAKDRSDPVYLGGPVGPATVFALLHSSSKIDGAENIFDGVFLISDKALFEKTMSARRDSGVFHVYVGYAGWTQEQLRNEVELGAWFVFPGDASTVFNSDPESLWLQMIRKTEMEFTKLNFTNPGHNPEALQN